MNGSTKKIICDLLVGFMCVLGLFLDKTEEQSDQLVALDEHYAHEFCKIMGLHPIVVKFFSKEK